MAIVKGNLKDLMWTDDERPYCPHCEETLRANSIDMGGNHFYIHTCTRNGHKNQVRYQYYGALFDLRRIRDE